MSTSGPNAPTPAQPASVAASRSGTPQKATSGSKRNISATDIFFVTFSGIAFALAVAGVATPVLEPYTGAGLRSTLWKTCTIINNEVVKGTCGSVQHGCNAQKSVFQATQAMELIAVVGTGLLLLTSALDCLVMNIGCGAAPSGGIRLCGRLRLRGLVALVLSAFSIIGFALAFSIATKSHCPGRPSPTGTNGGYEVGPNAPLFVAATVALLIMAIQDVCSTRPEDPESDESNDMEMSYVYGRAPGASMSVAPAAVASGRASPALLMSHNTPHLQPQPVSAAPVARNGADTPLVLSSRGPSPMGGLPPPAPAKTAPALPVPVASVRVSSTTPSAAAPF